MLRLARLAFWGWQAVLLAVALALGLALLFEETFRWPELAGVLAPVGMMAVLVIVPAWIAVTAGLSALLLLERWRAGRGEATPRGGA